ARLISAGFSLQLIYEPFDLALRQSAHLMEAQAAECQVLLFIEENMAQFGCAGHRAEWQLDRQLIVYLAGMQAALHVSLEAEFATCGRHVQQVAFKGILQRAAAQ